MELGTYGRHPTFVQFLSTQQKSAQHFEKKKISKSKQTQNFVFSTKNRRPLYSHSYHVDIAATLE